MATAYATADTTPVTLFTVDLAHRGKLSSIIVDNQSGGSRTLVFQDVFTPNASVGTPSPVLQTKIRKQITVGNLLSGSLDELDLEDVDVLGILQVVADAISVACKISVSYHEE